MTHTEAKQLIKKALNNEQINSVYSDKVLVAIENMVTKINSVINSEVSPQVLTVAFAKYADDLVLIANQIA